MDEKQKQTFAEFRANLFKYRETSRMLLRTSGYGNFKMVFSAKESKYTNRWYND